MPTSRPVPATSTPVDDISIPTGPDIPIEDELALADGQEEAEDARMTILPADKELEKNGSGGNPKNASYEPEGAPRSYKLSFTPGSRKMEDRPTVLRKRRNCFARIMNMLERRGSSYSMEAAGDNHFKMADTSIGDWIEKSAPVLGEHLLFLSRSLTNYSSEYEYETSRSGSKPREISNSTTSLKARLTRSVLLTRTRT